MDWSDNGKYEVLAVKEEVAEYLWKNYGDMYREGIEKWLEAADEIMGIISKAVVSSMPKDQRSRRFARQFFGGKR